MEFSKPFQFRFTNELDTSETENEKPAPIYGFNFMNPFQNYNDLKISFIDFELNTNFYSKEFEENSTLALNEFGIHLSLNSQELLETKNFTSKMEVKEFTKKEKNHQQIFKTEYMPRFQIKNIMFEKTGNNIKKNSERYENYRQKIIRNFIQNIAIFWICDEQKNIKLTKITQKFLLYKYIDYKGIKLKEIYGEGLRNNQENKKIIKNAKGSMLLKLNFKFEEAFKAFCFKKERKNILVDVVNRELENKELSAEEKEEFKKWPDDAENFFIKLKSKQEYINEKIIQKDDLNLFQNCFQELIDEFNINIG